jgi:putative addiction module killer protein
MHLRNDNVYVIIENVLDVREYVDADGRSPFTKWLRALNVQAAAKVATALERIADGNLSNVKGVGGGVLEYRVDFGPGYRIYFGRDGGQARHSACRRHEEAPATGRPAGASELGRLPEKEDAGEKRCH